MNSEGNEDRILLVQVLFEEIVKVDKTSYLLNFCHVELQDTNFGFSYSDQFEIETSYIYNLLNYLQVAILHLFRFGNLLSCGV